MDARWVFNGGPNTVFKPWASRFQSTRLSVSSGGNCTPGSASGRWYGEGSQTGQ